VEEEEEVMADITIEEVPDIITREENTISKMKKEKVTSSNSKKVNQRATSLAEDSTETSHTTTMKEEETTTTTETTRTENMKEKMNIQNLMKIWQLGGLKLLKKRRKQERLYYSILRIERT